MRSHLRQPRYSALTSIPDLLKTDSEPSATALHCLQSWSTLSSHQYLNKLLTAHSQKLKYQQSQCSQLFLLLKFGHALLARFALPLPHSSYETWNCHENCCGHLATLAEAFLKRSQPAVGDSSTWTLLRSLRPANYLLVFFFSATKQLQEKNPQYVSKEGNHVRTIQKSARLTENTELMMHWLSFTCNTPSYRSDRRKWCHFC